MRELKMVSDLKKYLFLFRLTVTAKFVEQRGAEIGKELFLFHPI